MADVKVVVVHPKLYLAVKGKKTHVEAGSELTVTTEQAKSLGKKVASLADRKKVKADEVAKKPKAE